MKVVFTAAAAADLERIGDAIALDKPRRAVTFIGEMRENCRAIGRKPFAYPAVGKRLGEEVRRKVHGNYLIFYWVVVDVVEVLHVLHGAMMFDDIVFGGGDGGGGDE